MSNFARVLLLGSLTLSLSAHANECAGLLSSTNLTFDQIEALQEARSTSRELVWRGFTKMVGTKRKTVVILGERARALAGDVEAARPVLDLFERIGTTSGSSNHGPTTSYASEFLAGLLMMPSFAIRALFTRGRVAPPSRCAKDVKRCRIVQNLEQLHRPHWTEEANLLGFAALDFASVAMTGPAVYAGLALARGFTTAANIRTFAWTAGTVLAVRGALAIAERFSRYWPIVKNRDASIARHMDAEAESKARGAFLAIVSRAHVDNLARTLTTEYGFEEVDLDASALSDVTPDVP